MCRKLALIAAAVLTFQVSAAAQNPTLIQVRKLITRANVNSLSTSASLAVPADAQLVGLQEILVIGPGPFYARTMSGRETAILSGEITPDADGQHRISVDIGHGLNRANGAPGTPARLRTNSSQARLKAGDQFVLVGSSAGSATELYVVSLMPWPRQPAMEIGVTPSADNAVPTIEPGDFDPSRGSDAHPDPQPSGRANWERSQKTTEEKTEIRVPMVPTAPAQ